MAEPAEIYDGIARLGTRCALPGPWSHYKADEAFFRLDTDASQLLTALQGAFALCDLTKAGVIHENPPGVPELHPALSARSAMLLALRASEKAKPFALQAGVSCMDQKQWPICEAMKDYRTRQQLDGIGRRLLVAFSYSDFMVLRSLGFPATTATGLQRFSKRHLGTLSRALRLDQLRGRASITGVAEKSYWDTDQMPVSLVLVDWSLSELELTVRPEVELVKQHLQQLHANLHFPAEHFAVWKPAPESINRIQYCLETGQKTHVREACLESCDEDSFELIARPTRIEPAAQNLSDLRKAWIALQRDGSDPSQRERVWRQLTTVQQQQLVEPLISQACATSDPLDRNLSIVLADATSILHKQSLALTASHARLSVERAVNGSPVISREEFQQWHTTLNHVKTLTQGLLSSKASKQPRLGPKAVPSKNGSA